MGDAVNECVGASAQVLTNEYVAAPVGGAVQGQAIAGGEGGAVGKCKKREV